MGGSLKDQLLKAGLVNKQQVKKAAHEQRKARNQPAPAPRGDDIAQRQAQKAERDRELNRQRQEEAERKALAAQIKQLIEANRVEKWEGDRPYHFTDGSKVRRIYVSSEIHEQLVRGTLAIAKLAGRHHLVGRDAAEKIHERDPARVILPSAAEEQIPESDDPYAAYQVPDDLIW